MENTKKIYVVKTTGKSGKDYFKCEVDFGYRIATLTFNASDCAELLGISMAELFAMEKDKKHFVKL